MELQLDDEQARELRDLLADAIRELSSEIADTDNPAFQRKLRSRRQHLQGVAQQLASSTAS
jgi:hypothetical protein